MQVLCIDADLKELATVRRFIEAELRPFAQPVETVAEIRLAIDELLTNTIIHGYNGERGQIEITLRHDSDRNQLVITVRDQARVFNPFTAPRRTGGNNTDQLQLGGYGLQLIRQGVDDASHRVTRQGGNELTLIKRLSRIEAQNHS